MRETPSSLHRSISSTVFALCERKYTRARSLRAVGAEDMATETISALWRAQKRQYGSI